MSEYNRRTWLNRENSTFTGSVVCCHMPESSRRYSTFLEIADCNGKVQLHKGDDDADSLEAFICKLKLLRDEIEMFITALEIDIKQASLIERQMRSDRS